MLRLSHDFVVDVATNLMGVELQCVIDTHVVVTLSKHKQVRLSLIEYTVHQLNALKLTCSEHHMLWTSHALNITCFEP